MPNQTYWVSPVAHPGQDVGVFRFRCELNLEQIPESLLIDVSADQRYRLFVNGEQVEFGPQRSDLAHWYYETIDLAPNLHLGENVVEAVVWNFGWLAPIAQMTLRAGFVCRSEDARLNTPGEWKVCPDPAWSFARMTALPNPFYMEVGPGETYDVRKQDRTWTKPTVIVDWRDAGSLLESIWGMTPRTLPSMRYEVRDTRPVVRHGFAGDLNSQGEDGRSVGESIELGNGPMVLDYTELVCAFPRFAFRGPFGTTVTITYDESLWESEELAGVYGSQPHKGNRNDVAGKVHRGYQDHVILDGESVTFEPLWWRTYRYLTLEATGPVTLELIEAVETSYPYVVESKFTAEEPTVAPIWDVAVRTAKLCAGETYFDCPYYEQLQYAGDTRIQALIHYYLSRDRRLPRNAVDQLGGSLQSNGLTQSRYPNRTPQFIPPFCLWWIQMLRDQMLYDGELTPSRHWLEVARVAKLSFQALQADERGGQVAHWMFGDWVPAWPMGVPPGGANSTLQSLTLFLAEIALECLTEGKVGPERLVDFGSQFFIDAGLVRAHGDPSWEPSEHAEALFRLTQAALGLAVDPWPADKLASVRAKETTLYFSFYKHQAMGAADYLAELGPWRQMIEDGLTTFAETPEPARSDCHAWSAHPILGFFQLVAGVTSIAPQWSKARIAPNPGTLRNFSSTIAHPKGELMVNWDFGQFDIEVPVPAEFVWAGKTSILLPGHHRIVV